MYTRSHVAPHPLNPGQAQGIELAVRTLFTGRLLIGLAITASQPGGWWLDPAVGLVIAAPAVWQGIHSWHGEDCCCLPRAAILHYRSEAAQEANPQRKCSTVARIGDP